MVLLVHFFVPVPQCDDGWQNPQAKCHYSQIHPGNDAACHWHCCTVDGCGCWVVVDQCRSAGFDGCDDDGADGCLAFRHWQCCMGRRLCWHCCCWLRSTCSCGGCHCCVCISLPRLQLASPRKKIVIKSFLMTTFGLDRGSYMLYSIWAKTLNQTYFCM